MTAQEIRKLLQDSAKQLREDTDRYRELLATSRLLHGKALVKQSAEMQCILQNWGQSLERHIELTKLYSEAMLSSRPGRETGIDV